MSKALIIIGIVVVVAIGWLVISKTGQQQNPSPAITATQEKTPTTSGSEKAPDFHLQDYNGKTVSLADFSGKPLVINSWASWCPFCQQELSDFATAQKEFADKVIIIAIDRAESRNTAKKYTDELGITDDVVFLLDSSDSFYQSIGGFSMPETIFVDSSGSIIFHKRGPMDIQEIREKIQQLISQ